MNMGLQSFGTLVFLQGMAVGIAFAVRTRRFVPTSVLRALACICFGFVVVPRAGNALWRLTDAAFGPGNALVVAHLPTVAMSFALLAVGLRGLVSRGESATE